MIDEEFSRVSIDLLSTDPHHEIGIMNNRGILNECIVGNQMCIEQFIGNRGLFSEIST